MYLSRNIDKAIQSAGKKTKTDIGYITQRERSIILARTIIRHLGVASSLFFEYESSVSLADGIYLEKVYEAGFEDGERSVVV